MTKTSNTQNARLLRKNETQTEQILWSWLRSRKLGCKFRRQQPVGSYIVDFACMELSLIIEIDGGQHSNPSNESKDNERTGWLESQGFRVLRFWNNDVISNLDGVVGTIKMTVDELMTPSSRPSPIKGEGANH